MRKEFEKVAHFMHYLIVLAEVVMELWQQKTWCNLVTGDVLETKAVVIHQFVWVTVAGIPTGVVPIQSDVLKLCYGQVREKSTFFNHLCQILTFAKQIPNLAGYFQQPFTLNEGLGGVWDFFDEESNLVSNWSLLVYIKDLSHTLVFDLSSVVQLDDMLCKRGAGGPQVRVHAGVQFLVVICNNTGPFLDLDIDH